MKIGFIGLGNVGEKLARSLLRNKFNLSYEDNMLQNIIEIFILSAIQGISEFLPISSSAHLIIVSSLYQFKSSSLLISLFQDSPYEYSDEANDKGSDLRPRKADNEKRKGF